MKYIGIPNANTDKRESPPSRGAWIEITNPAPSPLLSLCRPPRGGRGLKSYVTHETIMYHVVAPLAGGVD